MVNNEWVVFDSETRERLGELKSSSPELKIYLMSSGFEIYPLKYARRKSLWELRIMYDVQLDGWNEEEWVN